MINKEKITVGVHDGQFHADDVLCVVMLMYKYGKENVNIIRSRNLEILSTCDYILDVGGKDQISEDKVFLDHHQKESTFYENGVKMAACGKLANYLFSDDKTLLEGMKKDFLYAIEMADNGQKLDINIKKSDFEFIAKFNPTWFEDKNMYDIYFKQAVETTLPVFEHTLEKIKARELAIDIFEDSFKKYDKNDRILFLKQYIPWESFVVDKNKEGANIAAVCFKDSNNNYSVWSVPPEKDEFCPPRLPKEWATLRDEELQKVSGIKSAIFCFGPRCFFQCSDKKDALKVALIMAEKQKEIEQEKDDLTL